MNISIIIPTYNEGDTIGQLLNHLKAASDDVHEILVVDGGSSDNTVAIAQEHGVQCITVNKSRARQLNKGAQEATGDVLYFVHADSIPPQSFASDIKKALSGGYDAGCYRFRFNSSHPLLKINAYMTRFDRLMCRGGDQTLFIQRALFQKLGGFRDDYQIMEDFEFIERIQATANFRIIPKEVIVSARKYKENNYFRVQLANFIVFMMYFAGYSQERLLKTYRVMLTNQKF